MGYCLVVNAALGIPKKFSWTHHDLCRIRSATSSAGRVTLFCTRHGLTATVRSILSGGCYSVKKKMVTADEYAGTLSRGTAFLSHPKKQKIVPIPVNGEKSLASASSATWK